MRKIFQINKSLYYQVNPLLASYQYICLTYAMRIFTAVANRDVCIDLTYRNRFLCSWDIELGRQLVPIDRWQITFNYNWNLKDSGNKGDNLAKKLNYFKRIRKSQIRSLASLYETSVWKWQPFHATFWIFTFKLICVSFKAQERKLQTFFSNFGILDVYNVFYKVLFRRLKKLLLLPSSVQLFSFQFKAELIWRRKYDPLSQKTSGSIPTP